MRTTGYKRQRAEFQDLLYEHVSRIGTQTSAQGNILPVGIDLGSGVKTVGTPRLMTQGTLTPTGKPTRRRDPRRRLLQDPAAGRHLSPTPATARSRWTRRAASSPRKATWCSPASPFPQNSTGLTINAQGQVSACRPARRPRRPSSANSTLTRFINKAGLLPIGDNMFTETPASGTPQDGLPDTDGAGDLQQGNLEQSNVNAVTEITNLIAAQRAYEMNAQGHHRRRPDAAGNLQPDALRHDHDPHSLSPSPPSSRSAPPPWRRRPAAPLRPVLKAQATVTGDLVRIGDLVDNAGIVARRADLPRARPRHDRHGAGRSAWSKRCARTRWSASTPPA